MASEFLRKPDFEASPLQGLADYFERARFQAGTIWYAFPEDNVITANTTFLSLREYTLQIVKDHRAQGSEYSVEEVQAFVRALEPCDPQLCKRLDGRSLVIICSVIVHSQRCLAQQRGFYLLAVRMEAP